MGARCRGIACDIVLEGHSCALDGEIQAIVSVPLPIEYEAMLTRPHQLEATGPVDRGSKRRLGCPDRRRRARSVAVPLAPAIGGSRGRDGLGDGGKWPRGSPCDFQFASFQIGGKGIRYIGNDAAGVVEGGSSSI